jgi:hypothetical protein
MEATHQLGIEKSYSPVFQIDENFDIHTHRLIDQETSLSMLEFLQRVSRYLEQEADVAERRSHLPHIGLAPKEKEHNNILGVLQGCSVPVVLRPKGEREAVCYQLISEAGIYSLVKRYYSRRSMHP